MARMSSEHTARRTWATLWVTVVAALLVLAYGMHQRANAAPVQPTWQQSVVTIDDEATVAAAQAWGAPFMIRYAAQGADIHVTTAKLDDIVGGEAVKAVDGERVTGCTITLKPSQAGDVAVLAHEVGHCLGLHHRNEDSKSIMFYIQGGNSGSDSVTDADRAALSDLYAKVGHGN